MKTNFIHTNNIYSWNMAISSYASNPCMFKRGVFNSKINQLNI